MENRGEGQRDRTAHVELLGGARRNRIMNVLSSRAAKCGEPRVAEALIASLSFHGFEVGTRGHVTIYASLRRSLKRSRLDAEIPRVRSWEGDTRAEIPACLTITL